MKKESIEEKEEEEENNYDDVRDIYNGYSDPDTDNHKFKKGWTRHPDDNKEEEPKTKLN